MMYRGMAIALIIFCFTHVCISQNTVNAKKNTEGGMVIYKQKITLRVPVYTMDTLRFNRNKSKFKWNLYNPPAQYQAEMKKKQPHAKISGGGPITGQINLVDLKKDNIYSKMSLRQLNGVYYLEEKKPRINWEVKDSTKKIDNYMVKKATANFRGRHYSAWFAPEIPVSYGPWKLQGLPGLILQAYDHSGNIYFSAKKINFNSIITIDSISLNGKEHTINFKRYKEIMNNFKKVEKEKTLKMARSHFPNENIKDLKINLPDIQLMEIFK